MEFNDVYEGLIAPFPPEMVEVKPGAVSEDRGMALALAYVDARAYQARLDEVVGPDGWSVEYRPWGERGVICRLTILGVSREDVGEGESGLPNQVTSAAMQAFKRVCAAFGLGRYLYSLPPLWVPAKKAGRSWIIEDQWRTVQQMYEQADLLNGRRGQYLARINTLLVSLSEEELIEVGKHITARR